MPLRIVKTGRNDVMPPQRDGKFVCLVILVDAEHSILLNTYASTALYRGKFSQKPRTYRQREEHEAVRPRQVLLNSRYL